MFEHEAVFKNHENGMKVAQMLLEEGNAVMITYEEQLLVLNWIWCEGGYSDRNQIVFMHRSEYDEELDKFACDIMAGE